MSQENYPPGFKYSSEHSWLELGKDGIGIIGITNYAQSQLKKIVYVELPELGVSVQFMEPFGTIESVKATNDLYSPINGKVVEINTSVINNPQIINEDPYGKGWLITVKVTDLSEIGRLMSSQDYKLLLGVKG